MISMIITELVIFYVVLRIGDIFGLVGDISNLFIRHMPIGIASVICTYFLIIFGAKKAIDLSKKNL